VGPALGEAGTPGPLRRRGAPSTSTAGALGGRRGRAEEEEEEGVRHRRRPARVGERQRRGGGQSAAAGSRVPEIDGWRRRCLRIDGEEKGGDVAQ
jgi:hypothetical protein